LTRVAVIGAGGMGSVVAGHLVRSGVDTLLVGRSADHVNVVARQGLRLRDADGREQTVALPATTTPERWGIASHVVILTKAFDTDSAAASAAIVSGPDTFVTTLQNGLGNVEVIAQHIDAARVLPGTTTIGATLEAPGIVSASAMTAAGSSQTYLGPSAYDAGSIEEAARLAAVLRRRSTSGSGPSWRSP
jgi:2-dehydropantoate 2-reductase